MNKTRAHSAMKAAFFFCSALSLICAGCGGGGGGNTPAAPSTSTSTSTQTTTTATTPSTTGTITGTVSLPANTNAKLFDVHVPLYVRMMASPAHAAAVTDLTKLTVKADTATTNPDSNGNYALSVPAAANIEISVMAPSGNVILQAVVPEVKAGAVTTQSVDTTTTAVALIYQKDKTVSLSQIQSSPAVTAVKNEIETALADENEDSILTNTTVASAVETAATSIITGNTPVPVCGNGVCDSGETTTSCAEDCASGSTTETEPIPTITGVTATSTSSNIIRVTWNSVAYSALAGYVVYRAEDVGGTPGEFVCAGEVSPGVTFFDDEGKTCGQSKEKPKEKKEALVTGKSFWYQVAAKNTKGEIGGFSAIDEKDKTNMATVGAKAKPNAPTVNPAKPSGGKAFLTWTPPTTRADAQATQLLSSEISGYWVYYSANSSSFSVNNRAYFAHTAGSTQITGTVTGLTNNTLYYFVVTTVDTDNQESAFSSIVSATPVAASAPMTPAWTKACAAIIVNASTGEVDDPNCSLLPSAAAIQIKWNSVTLHKDGTCYKNNTGCTTTPYEDVLAQYRLYRTAATTLITDRTQYSLIQSVIPGTGTEMAATDQSVTNDTTYFYYIRAINDEGTESELPLDNSDILGPVMPKQATTGGETTDTPPTAPAGVSATAGISKVTLTWNAVDAGTENDLEGYNVYMSATSTNPQNGFTKFNSSPIQDTSLVVSGLTNGATYYFYITAVDKSGGLFGIALESQPSSVVSGIPQPPVPPSSPQWYGSYDTPKPIVPGVGTITLNWKAVTTDINGNTLNAQDAPLTKYRIYRSASTNLNEGANGEYTLLAEVNVPAATYTDATANNFTSFYFYRVDAVLSDGTAGPLSEYRYGMPQQAFLPRLKNAFLAFVTRITKYISG